MQFRLDRFFFDEKDLFVLAVGVLLVVSFVLKMPLYPFRFDSLVVVFLFLLLTRSLMDTQRFTSYLIIALLGLIFSMFLSPYGLLIFYFIALVIYNKTKLI